MVLSHSLSIVNENAVSSFSIDGLNYSVNYFISVIGKNSLGYNIIDQAQIYITYYDTINEEFFTTSYYAISLIDGSRYDGAEEGEWIFDFKENVIYFNGEQVKLYMFESNIEIDLNTISGVTIG